MIAAKTPAEAAAFIFRMAGPKADPKAVEENFLAVAADLRSVAQRAAGTKSGKFRGYTPESAMAAAVEMQARATSVPTELRKLLG